MVLIYGGEKLKVTVTLSSSMDGDLCPDMGDAHSSTTTCTFYIESGMTSGLKSGTVKVWAHE